MGAAWVVIVSTVGLAGTALNAAGVVVSVWKTAGRLGLGAA